MKRVCTTLFLAALVALAGVVPFLVAARGPLILDDSLDVTAFTLGFLERLQIDVAERLRRAY